MQEDVIILSKSLQKKLIQNEAMTRDTFVTNFLTMKIQYH